MSVHVTFSSKNWLLSDGASDRPGASARILISYVYRNVDKHHVVSSMTDTPPRPSRRLTHRLSAVFVRTAPPGFYCDGHGLNLRVDPSGARRWVQRLVIRGRPRMLGLGGYPLVSLAEARDVAFAHRKQAQAGGDPLTEQRHAQHVPTVEEAAAVVLEGVVA